MLVCCRKLSELGLLEPLVGQPLTSIIYVHIEGHIIKTCKDSFDVSYVNSLEKVLRTRTTCIKCLIQSSCILVVRLCCNTLASKSLLPRLSGFERLHK